MIFVLCNDCKLDNIIEEQYILARRAKIGWLDTNGMPDFERKLVIGFLRRDQKKEEEETKP